MECKIVVGANYGDECKGMVTHALTREHLKKGKVLNILYNGGCQRGHTVEYQNGLKHIFKHFGGGTIDGADTYFNKDFIINPIQYVCEYNELIELNNNFKVFAHRDCRVSTPWDMMLNQMIETKRDKNRHGSCGWGIFETRKRYETSKWNWSFMEMRCATNNELYTYLESLAKEYVPSKLKEYNIDSTISQQFCSAAISSETIIRYIEEFRLMCKSLNIIYVGDLFKKYNTIIYEGGQGLALSENNGKDFPYLTPSKTGSEIPIVEIKPYTHDIEVCYVTRTYLTRHGAGPLPLECDKKCINNEIEDNTNIPNEYQKSLRFAPLNVVELLDRINLLDNHYYKKSIHLTHWNYGGLLLKDLKKLQKYFTKDNMLIYDNRYGDVANIKTIKACD